MTERQNVEIDYCPQCRGVWLDKGELDKIIDRTAPGDSGSSSTSSSGDYYEKGRNEIPQGKYYPHKKKKGFLGDLFDFD
jgi:uncharacterized protein